MPKPFLKTFYCSAGVRFYHGDCLDILPKLGLESVDSIVTDPPYGLKFMGKNWDHSVPGVHFWEAMLGVAKPGAHLLAFGGTRTFHRLACAIEDAGWEIRDTIMWVYGSGFPKSLDVSKAIDKAAGAEREIIGRRTQPDIRGDSYQNRQRHGKAGNVEILDTVPATKLAKRWNGWGTALKPSYEPIIVARKPLEGTVAQNVQRYGTGALNIDGCRIGTDVMAAHGGGVNHSGRKYGGGNGIPALQAGSNSHVGRFPANLIHDGSEEVLARFPESKDGIAVQRHGGGQALFGGIAGNTNSIGKRADVGYGSGGSAARFFYCAKASREERGEGNTHPTVKPLALMRYLVRLVAPPGGIVLDSFLGSGTTALACVEEGFRCFGIEEDQSTLEIAVSRLKNRENAKAHK